MNIKKIITTIKTNSVCNVGMYVTLGVIGSQGLAHNAETIQALGLATVAISAWQISKTGYKKLTSGKEKREEQLKTISLSYEHDEKSEKKTKYLKDCYDRGIRYQTGRGTAVDYKKAFDCFYEGAKSGSQECAIKLGGFYEDGRYIPKNDFLARYWYEEAAIRNSPEAYYLLARWYLDHPKTKKTMFRIVYFLDSAVNSGYTQAIKLKNELLEKGGYSSKSIENLIVRNDKNIIYDFANRKNLRKFIFKGGTSKPSEIIQSYKLLGFAVPPNMELPDLSLEVIRKSYHARMKMLHPDVKKQVPEDKEKIVQLTAAYELLFKLNS